MTLRSKALLVVGISLLLVVVALYITSRFVLIGGLTWIEQQDAQKRVEQTLTLLSQDVLDLENETTDWASWDDSYAFIENGNQAYIDSNLPDSTFVHLRLNLALYINSSGELVYGKVFDIEKEEQIPVSDDLLTLFVKNGLLGEKRSPEKVLSGLSLVNAGPLIFAAQPILTSDGAGPSRGTLIFGRYLNSTELNRLSRSTLANLTVYRIDGTMPPDFQDMLPFLKGSAILSEPLSTRYIAGYTIIRDINDTPALILRVDIPRDLYQLGQSVITYYILVTLGIGLLIAGAAVWIIQKQVMSRFANLIKGVNNIATTGDLSTRVPVTGKDELALVAGTINGMLAALQESSAELHERYEHEKTLRQQLEDEIKKRAEFTRALVHELKTPITPVLAASELLLEEIQEEKLKRLVQSIDRSASNLNQRIDELLDLARGETGVLQLTLEPLDPLALLLEITSEMTLVASRNGQTLVVELPSSLPRMMADMARLRQIVLNLLSNAFKFTPAGGKITLRARMDETNLIVEVEDTGSGISEEDQQHLFEPYYRKVTDRERLGGLGLGLAISKGFVELHGGKIWVSSKKGKGSAFTFSIPLEQSNRKSQENHKGEPL